MSTKEYLSIGDISKLTGLSKKQLRNYDELGICSPAYKNSETGYRFYAREQISFLEWISTLRSLNFSIQDISEIVNSNSIHTVKKVIDKYVVMNRTNFERARYQYEQTAELPHQLYFAMRYLDMGPDSLKVSLINIEPANNYISDWNVFAGLNDNEWRFSAFSKLQRELEQKEFVGVGGYGLFFGKHPFLSDYSEEAHCMVFSQIKGESQNVAHSILVTASVPALTYAHVGPYQTIHESYERVIQYAKDHDLKLGTEAAEEYQILKYMTGDESACVTNLYIPLAGYHFFKDYEKLFANEEF